MFERYLSDVITSYFGQYIIPQQQPSSSSSSTTTTTGRPSQQQQQQVPDHHPRHNKIQISTSWNGGITVQLHNVQLRHDCLQQMVVCAAVTMNKNKNYNSSTTSCCCSSCSSTYCPIEIVHGHIGQLEIRIPWKIVRDQFVFVSTTHSTSRSRSNNNPHNNDSNSNKISILLRNVNLLMAPIQQQQSQQQQQHSNHNDSTCHCGRQQQQQQERSSSSSFLPQSSSLDSSKTNNEVLFTKTTTTTTTATGTADSHIIHPNHHRTNPSKNDDDDIMASDTQKEEKDDDDDDDNNTNVDIQHERSIQAALDAELLQRVALSTTVTTEETVASSSSSSSSSLPTTTTTSTNENSTTGTTPTTNSSSSNDTTKQPSSSIPTTSWKQRFMERFQSILISNLFVTLQNIHIRYEDAGTGYLPNNIRHHYGHRTATATTTTTGTTYHTNHNNNHPLNTDYTQPDVPRTPEPTLNRTTTTTTVVSPLTLPLVYATTTSTGIPHDNQHHHNHRPLQQQYRPSFAIGVTLREFTIQQLSSSTKMATTMTTATTKSTSSVGGSSSSSSSHSSVPTMQFKDDTKQPSSQRTSIPSNKVVIAAAHEVALYWDNDSTTTRLFTSITNNNTIEYYQTAFHQLNRNDDHSYLLDPFSPSIEFGLLPTTMPTTVAVGDTSTTTGSCNTMDITFPPCRWNLSKHLFDDVKYLRKSISNWWYMQQQQRQIQEVFVAAPDAIRHRLYEIRQLLRPPNTTNSSSSATTFHPRQWWHYSYAAVTMLLRDNHNNTNSSGSTATVTRHRTNIYTVSGMSHHTTLIRRRGWIGLAQALGRRNQYIDVMINFLRYHDDINGRKEQYHKELLNMERSLLVEEVKSFRIASYENSQTDETIWMWIESLIVDQDLDDSNHEGNDLTTTVVDINLSSTILSTDHRLQMFIEMATALRREQTNLALYGASQSMVSANTSIVNNSTSTTSDTNTKLAWRIKLNCIEFALLVNDSAESHEKKKHRSVITIPVVRLSCAFSHDQELFECGSWNMTTRIGSLLVQDGTIESSTIHATQFPNLVALNTSSGNEIHANDTFNIDDTIHNQIIWVQIQRVKWKIREEIVRSRTETNVRVLPLEVVYSTAPVEALSHIFSTTNDDFNDDYNLIMTRLSIWKNRQQKRFINALAHKQKQMYFNVVIGSPVLLVPVVVGHLVADNSLVIFDLGQLHFQCEKGNKARMEYDDQWLLEMKDVQVKSMLTATYSSTNSTDQHPRYIIEPFSLRFDIFTKVQTDASDSTDEDSAVLAVANLPRLALNVNSTDVFHVSHLRSQWAKRKRERRPMEFHKKRSLRRTSDQNQGQDSTIVNSRRSRRLEFRFISPIFSVRFETKSKQRDIVIDSIPLFDFALKGIEGNFVRTVSSQRSHTTFCAKVRGLIAIDLFQPAGVDYSIMLSSITPEMMQGVSSVNHFSDKYLSGDHLVTFEYSSKVDHHGEVAVTKRPTINGDRSDSVKVNFHELFVEWNPETIAMISAAIWSPAETADDGVIQQAETDVSRKSDENNSQHDDEFFDAEEDAFYDAESAVSDEEGSRLLSEISESERSSVSDFNAISNAGSLSPWASMKVPLPVLNRPTLPGSPWSVRSIVPSVVIHANTVGDQLEQFVIIFELSKLRVDFNKESRRRRLITAEMDGTKVYITTVAAGGSKILCKIGNLTFSDCESAYSNTLYREILGLKTDESSRCGDQSSLFEMEMITKPRLRQFVTLTDTVDDLASLSRLPVFVDITDGVIHGFDNYFQAKLSPMRFVYLQQLWFEIVDYFFTGIVGYEVWGSTSPVPGDTTMLDGKSISADEVSFTRFDIMLQSPTILFPVSPCSTDFIRMTASSVSLRNWYRFDTLRPPTLFFRLDGVNRQWYNNCDITIEEIELCSWSGSALNPGDCRPTAKLSLSWPVGPSAPVNVPKWNVFCSVDEANIVLDRDDYSLLQHVIQLNIGSSSLHMEEWGLLQRLDSISRTCFSDNLLVHFPYDKKDSTPSTFDMTLTIPNLSAVLTHGKDRDIATIRCSNVQWKYSKFLDRVSRQNVTCNVDIVDAILGSALLSSEKNAMDHNRVLPKMEYTSCLYPTSKSEKTLLITNACIDIIYPSWMSVSGFFQDLPLPAYLSPNEAIQVGDRWYKIGNQPSRNTYDERLKRLSWIDELGPNISDVVDGANAITQPATFNFSLINPAVQVSSGLSVLILSIEKFDFLHNFSVGKTLRTVQLNGVEFQTRQANVRRPSDFSLIRPWNVEAIMNSYQEVKSGLWSHSYSATADVLHARTAFSDIIVALDACINLLRDIRASNPNRKSEARYLGGSESTGPKSRSDETPPVLNFAVNQRISILWKGIRFVLLDDSGRHFLQDQDIALVGVQTIDFTWRNSVEESCSDCEPSSAEASDSKMRLHILAFYVTDCLQSKTSPFREVVSVMSKSQTSEENNGIPSGIEIWSKLNESKSYGVDFPDIAIQYNPSFVVALQRFLGRLSKEAKHKHGDFFQKLTAVVADRNGGAADTSSGPISPYKLSVSIPSLSLLLNKEHQNRRLLSMSITGVHIESESCRTYSKIKGHVENVSATDPMRQGQGLAGIVLRSTNEQTRFVEFVYTLFINPQSANMEVLNDFPLWIQSTLTDDGVIDDILDLSIGRHDIVHIKERTAELLDYMSNGMPGKGMGATSRAAKGFVDERFLRRTYANIQIGVPRVLVPGGQGCDELFIDVKLGNLTLKSWATPLENSSQSRMISVVLNGFSVGLQKESNCDATYRPLMDDLDFEVVIEINDALTTLCCSLSAVVFRLSYVDYVSVRCIVRENLMKLNDRHQWDNLEKAWAKESDESSAIQDDSISNSTEIVYSSSARVVRYGQSKKRSAKSTPIKATAKCVSLGLVLRRDDTDHVAESSYDMIGFRGEGFECELGITGNGEQWFNLSIGSIFVADLGRMGRLLRSYRVGRNKSQTTDAPQTTNAVGVLVEGYYTNRSDDSNGSDVVDSQLVVKVEKEPITGEINIVIIISFISVTAFVEPLQDLIKFLTCKWDIASLRELSTSKDVSIEKTSKLEESPKMNEQWRPSYSSKVSFRFVSHYGRFVFAADELDCHSRCLIVRGLSIANVSFLPSIDDVNKENCSLKLNMDFQDVSSHMNPDISDIVGIRTQHTSFFVGILSANDMALLDHKIVDLATDDLSTPLLLPLTVSIEYEQETSSKEPTLRSLAISVDPVSVLFSNDDVKLVRGIVDAWTSTTRDGKQSESSQKHFYEVIFKSERLGLGLRKETGQIVVDNIADLKNHESIQTGDSIYAVNGNVISDIVTISLNEMVSRLSSTPRPLTVTFLRQTQNQVNRSEEREMHQRDIDTKPGTIDKINISIASAVITVVEMEVPLLKVAISMTKVACNIMRSKGTAIRLEVSSGTSIDYYNLKIWGWEPFVEPGVFYLSLTFQDAHHGPRELSVEIGDREVGVSINITDSLMETISKLLNCRSDVIDLINESSNNLFVESDGTGLSGKRDVSVDAANAAFHFAARQKSGMSKPFEFRNRTGISIAFAKQRKSQREVNPTDQFNYVGEYEGLQHCKSSDITVLSNGEDLKFRIDVNSFGDERYNTNHAGRFPSFTVALQKTAGVSVGPLENLETSRPGETFIPLIFGRNPSITSIEISPVRRWATWLVEQSDEKTVVTLGSSIRVVSVLRRTIEIGIAANPHQTSAPNNRNIMSLGILREGVHYNMPLWIAMQTQSWICYVRLGAEFVFTPIFTISPDGSIDLQRTSNGCIECRRYIGNLTSSWLAASLCDNGGLSVVSIDCMVSIRNLLPVSIDWEIGQDSKLGDNFMDGSVIRSQCLLSGEEAEVLTCNFLSAKIRLCPTEGDFIWSSWTSLSLQATRSNFKQSGQPGEDGTGSIQEDSYTTVYVKDMFHVNLPLGLRISSKANGIDVTVYSDLWCTNCTSLDLIFGSPIAYEQFCLVEPTKTLTVGEATLKEISSLFESGDFTRRIDSSSCNNVHDIIRIPGQVCSQVTEECFEYVEIEGNAISSRWWASENPFSTREYLMGSDQEQCRWIDKTWKVDSFGSKSDSWESSTDLDSFVANRIFNPSHRYRRRRWSRTRHGMSDRSIVNSVNAFVQLPRDVGSFIRDGKPDNYVQLAIQVNGGRWSQIASIPRQGSFHGVVRVSKSRWLYTAGETLVADKTVYELCYVVSPLDGDWGLLTRSLFVTSRFLLRNDSKAIEFEVKQTGASDTSSLTIQPGQTIPFHWGSYHLPDLVSIRPITRYQGRCLYKWSGGFDPLLIGHLPLRLRRSNASSSSETAEQVDGTIINAVKVEIEIRPQTGGTGINLAFQEEATSGEGALFRIQNLSPFPVWFCQDDILANPSRYTNATDYSDIVSPSKSIVFSLDIPFKQGKFSNRKAASLTSLLRVRLALAPLTTRAGIETAKVVSMNIGETVRLNPSKLMIISSEIRQRLQDVRIVGTVVNDGPTRVLRFSLTSQNSSDIKAWPNLNSGAWHDDVPYAFKNVVEGVGTNEAIQKLHELPSESEINLALERLPNDADALTHDISSESPDQTLASRNLIVSLRAAFSGLMVSLVDSAPSEIAMATFKNINALATWDTLRATDATIFITVTSVQVDNMVPNSPFPVAVCPFDQPNLGTSGEARTSDNDSPLLVVGLSFAPKHKSGILCLKSATIAPRNLAIKVDLAFLVRLQKFALDLREHFNNESRDWGGRLKPPDITRVVEALNAAAESGVGRQKIYFGGLTILPCNIKLSVAPARALTPAQAALEGSEIAAIHQAVRKGDIRVDKKSAGILGVKIGSRNKTPLAVVRGLFKSFIVDGLLRLDGASLNFSGVSLRNHTSTTSQLTTALTAHYLDSLRQNLPAVLGSLAAFGNPLGLVRGLGEGVGDFVLEPVRGFQRSVQEMDASYLVDGVARGTLSLTRHTVGGFADSAAMIAETFSKNMAVLTLDRKYAQKRDRGEIFRDYDDINVASGLGSGAQKLVNGFMEGVTGVVRAPIRGAEKHGLEGFAKGIGKGLLGLLVKPIIGISDGFSDVMIGVKGTVEGGNAASNQPTQVRPRRALYGREKAIRSFHFPDAAASALMLRTRLASEPYLSHLDLGDRVILLSCKRGVMLGRHGEEVLMIKLKQIESVEIRGVTHDDGSIEWGVVIVLDSPSPNGNDVEVIVCHEKSQAEQLCKQFSHGKDVASNL